MVGKVIRDYMEGGAKKLTVPGFGTFMRRTPENGSATVTAPSVGNSPGGEVIFVDLLRGDDHTLSELVEDAGGYSDLEAMALIDRFIFETKTAIERHGSAVIEGFGTMTLDHKGVYQFTYSPKIRPVRETAVQERLFEQKELSRPVATTAGHNKPRPQMAPAKPGHRPRQHSPQLSRTDTILIVAIVAAVIALVALVFGMSSGNMPFLPK